MTTVWAWHGHTDLDKNIATTIKKNGHTFEGFIKSNLPNAMLAAVGYEFMTIYTIVCNTVSVNHEHLISACQIVDIGRENHYTLPCKVNTKT
jgi:hypothetical protein